MTGLVGDIGGTNARFALVREGGAEKAVVLASGDYKRFEDAIDAFLAQADTRPDQAVLAVAGPVRDGEAVFTNLDWRFSEAGLSKRFGFPVKLINDFAAQALAAPRLGEGDMARIGPDVTGVEGAPLLIMGAGTGLGAAALLRDGGREIVLSTEAGHIAFAPTDEVEVEIWRILTQRYGRCSIERILSGAGLHDLYAVIAGIHGLEAPLADRKAILKAAKHDDRAAELALERFCAIFGGAAGDLALALGAWGGVYLSGGIAPRIRKRLQAGAFRKRFEAKGRFADDLARTPTFVFTAKQPALVGAASLLEHGALA